MDGHTDSSLELNNNLYSIDLSATIYLFKNLTVEQNSFKNIWFKSSFSVWSRGSCYHHLRARWGPIYRNLITVYEMALSLYMWTIDNSSHWSSELGNILLHFPWRFSIHFEKCSKYLSICLQPFCILYFLLLQFYCLTFASTHCKYFRHSVNIISTLSPNWSDLLISISVNLDTLWGAGGDLLSTRNQISKVQLRKPCRVVYCQPTRIKCWVLYMCTVYKSL